MPSLNVYTDDTELTVHQYNTNGLQHLQKYQLNTFKNILRPV